MACLLSKIGDSPVHVIYNEYRWQEVIPFGDIMIYLRLKET